MQPIMTSRHPCFNKDASGECGRVHLPVAPKCNIGCRYCNRKYDCVNESRPGVTSAVLSPAQAATYVDKVLAVEPRITVIGIAGPGDPMAEPEKTLETIRRVHAKHPELLFCLSSNGLNLPDHVDELAEAGVTHMTVTVNAVDPEVGKNFYRFVRDGKVLYRGREAAELILSRQLESIRRLKAKGITVKVNTIVTPGYNDHHVEEVARKMRELGVDILNLIPLCPTADTDFAEVPEPTPDMIETLRAKAEAYLPQMRHCKRCRADAVGLLSHDRSAELAPTLAACAAAIPELDPSKPLVAVASMEGLLVNEHLGEAGRLLIYEPRPGGYTLLDERRTPPPGTGVSRWYALAELIKDCRAVLVSGIGDTPRTVLEEHNILPVEMSGFIEQGLDAVYKTGDLDALKTRRTKAACSAGCRGGGEGCG